MEKCHEALVHSGEFRRIMSTVQSFIVLKPQSPVKAGDFLFIRVVTPTEYVMFTGESCYAVILYVQQVQKSCVVGFKLKE